jgi:hypothetical protein
MADERTRIPADDTNLANLLAIWGYDLDAKHRVLLTKRTPEVGAVARGYTMRELRSLLRSRAETGDLRSMLLRYFQPPPPVRG